MGSFDLIGRPRESLFPTRGSQAHEEHKRSGGTVNRHIACLSAALSFAIQERRLTDRNPVSNTSRKRESRCRTRFLSDEERAALLDAVELHDHRPEGAIGAAAASDLGIREAADAGGLMSSNCRDSDMGGS